MSKKKSSNRSFNPFNLSFLDIMSCGLGAVILIFLILKHSDSVSPEQAELIKSDIQNIEESIEDIKTDIQVKTSLIKDLESKILEKDETFHTTQNSIDDQKNLRDETIEENKDIQQASNKTKETLPDIIKISGDGERQYLTGLKIEGRRIVYLLDSSASMLDENIQKIFRLSMMADDKKKISEKWIRAKKTLRWLVARLPSNSQFTIITFNEEIKSHTRSLWLDSNNVKKVSNALESALKEIPNGGTNLEKALLAAKIMSPQPDAVYIITDGLPTVGEPISRLSTSLKLRGCLKKIGKISPDCRHQLFEKAKEEYFKGKKIKTSTILFPLQGDRRAASDFWNLGLQSGGTTISPSRDWPQ